MSPLGWVGIVAVAVVAVLAGAWAIGRSVVPGWKWAAKRGPRLCYFCNERLPLPGDSICQRCAEDRAW